MKLCLILVVVLLSACATTRQRVIVVNVHDVPTQVDSTAVDHVECREEIERLERKKKFWQGATTVLLVLIVIEYFLQ